MLNDSEDLKTRQFINFLVRDRYRPWRHAALLIALFVLLYSSDFSHNYRGYYQYYSLLSVYVIFLLMFYMNIYLLVPYFFFKGRYLFYLGLLVILDLVGLSGVSYALNLIPDSVRFVQARIDPAHGFYERNVMSTCVIMVTTTLKLLQRWAKDNERMTELKTLALRMELNELRNQISPHFLFNMLNNVKALIRTNPEMATTVLMKLSEFLRFQLYEHSDEKTSLSSEIVFLSNFIDLEKIRRDAISVSIESKIDQPSLRHVFVPPNLFIIFVENALKHSVDFSGREAYIRLHFDILNNNLLFCCENSVSERYPASDKKSSGLGLVNIKRRLELLYPKKYRLDITSTSKAYTVNLSIPL